MRPCTATRSQAILLAGQALRLSVALAITAVVGRTLDASDFGFFALIGSVFFAARFLFDLGTGTVAVREITHAPERERPILEGLLAWRRVVGVALGLAALGFAVAERDPARRWVLVAVGLALPLLAPGALGAVFTLRQAQGFPTTVRTIGQLGVLGGALALASAGVPGALFAVLHVARELWSVAGVRHGARRLLAYRPRAGLRGRALRPFFAMAVLQGAAMLMMTASFHADVFLVRALRGEAELGAYAAAFRPVQPLLLLPAILLLPVLPLLARDSRADRAAFGRLVGGTAYAGAALGLVAAALGVLLAPHVLALLFGGAYAEGPLGAVGALRWMSLALGLAVAGAPLSAALSADHGERALLGVYSLALALNVALNLLLLPRYGFVAAAATTAATEGVTALALLVVLARRDGLRRGPSPAALWRELSSTPAAASLDPGPDA